MPNNAPLIAAVMPAYNAAAFLEEAIRSIMAQTFQAWELIVVDDCSADATAEIADRLAAEDPRIKVVRNPVNRREGNSRNIGIKRISPSVRYVATMDADDRCRPERFQRQFDFMEKHPECFVCGASIALMDERGRIFAERRYPCDADRIVKSFCSGNCFAHPTTMFRREIFSDYSYDAAHRCVDYDLLFRVLEDYDGCNLPEILLDYRLSPSQQKSRYLKETLLDSIKLQRTRLLDPRFFRVINLINWCAECVLYLLPGSVIYLLFRWKYFRRYRG